MGSNTRRIKFVILSWRYFIIHHFIKPHILRMASSTNRESELEELVAYWEDEHDDLQIEYDVLLVNYSTLLKRYMKMCDTYKRPFVDSESGDESRPCKKNKQ